MGNDKSMQSTTAKASAIDFFPFIFSPPMKNKPLSGLKNKESSQTVSIMAQSKSMW
jgi:hypothetical protein